MAAPKSAWMASSNEYGAIGTRNAEVAPEEKPQLAEDADHGTRSPLDVAAWWTGKAEKDFFKRGSGRCSA